jgi:hypothetical protein
MFTVSWRAVNDLDAKSRSRVKARLADKCTTFSSTQILRNWREQRPSKRGDWLESHGGGCHTKLHGDETALIVTVYCTTWLLLSCISNDTPCTCSSLNSYNNNRSLDVKQETTNNAVSVCPVFNFYFLLLIYITKTEGNLHAFLVVNYGL